MQSKYERLMALQGGSLEPITTTVLTLTYEIGDLAKAVCYMYRYPEYSKGYLGNAKAAVADAIAQLELICERLGIDFDEMRELGNERFLNSDEPDRQKARKQ